MPRAIFLALLSAAAAIKYPPGWCKDVSSPEACAKLVQDGSCAKSKTRPMCPLSCGLEDPSKSYTCTVDVANGGCRDLRSAKSCKKLLKKPNSDKGCTNEDGVPTQKGSDCRRTCELYGCTAPPCADEKSEKKCRTYRKKGECTYDESGAVTAKGEKCRATCSLCDNP